MLILIILLKAVVALAEMDLAQEHIAIVVIQDQELESIFREAGQFLAQAVKWQLQVSALPRMTKLALKAEKQTMARDGIVDLQIAMVCFAGQMDAVGLNANSLKSQKIAKHKCLLVWAGICVA